MSGNVASVKYHPVWDVYDLLRTAKLNINYYSVKTEAVRKMNLVLEIVLGIAVPSSAIAGMEWFQTKYGQSCGPPFFSSVAFSPLRSRS